MIHAFPLQLRRQLLFESPVDSCCDRISFWVENLGGGPNGFKALWDSDSLVNIVNSSSFAWTHFDFTLPAATNNTRLLFGAYQVPMFFGLDDVSVTDVSPVPEPASLALMVIGALGLGALGRRRLRARSKAARGLSGHPPSA
jgi:hypothetical protein